MLLYPKSIFPRSEIEMVESRESKEREEEDLRNQNLLSQEKHRQAGVLALDDGSLFEAMFEDDPDMDVLQQLPGAQILMTR